MRFAYTIVYVANVEESLAFFEQTFGLKRRFLHESGGYGELETGSTALAFAAHRVARENVGRDYLAADPTGPVLGFEVGLVVDDVPAACERAVAAGAELIAAPKTKPWDQIVAYVRTPDGLLLELCTEVG